MMIQHSLPLISATYNQNFTFKRAGEQPNESAAISPARWCLNDRSRPINSEHPLLNAEAPLASALLDVRCVMKFVGHRIADYALA
jgi:hypothetical protein